MQECTGHRTENCTYDDSLFTLIAASILMGCVQCPTRLYWTPIYCIHVSYWLDECRPKTFCNGSLYTLFPMARRKSSQKVLQWKFIHAFIIGQTKIATDRFAIPNLCMSSFLVYCLVQISEELILSCLFYVCFQEMNQSQ